MPQPIPLATYRLQLNAAFGFGDAARLVPYLHKLGITHLYASPFLKARPGSTHGYDIVDHTQLNPEFGGDAAFEELSQALAAADMGLILDFVPNHMGVGHADNQWWLDVLEWGPKSPYASYFDIDWSASPYGRKGTVLLPILGCPYGDALRNGEIKLMYSQGSFSIWYYEHHLPVRTNRYGDILRTLVNEAGAGSEAAGQALLELAGRYPDPDAPSREESPAFKAQIAAVPGGAEVIERGLGAYLVSSDDSARVLALHRLLERQHYRLAYWRVSVSEINYRRFFDVNDLAGIRVEDQKAFAAIHPLVVKLLEQGRLHGIRLDHIDGLYDPAQYCRRLQRLTRAAAHGKPPAYVVMEKILGEREPCPRFAGVAGTTGYEWLNLIAGVLVNSEGLALLDQLWRDITGERRSIDEMVQAAKILILDNHLNSEFTVLARMLARIAAGNWRTRDYTAERLRAALEAYVVHFPVYRTYVTGEGAAAQDRRTIELAIDAARKGWYGSDDAIFDFLREALTLSLVAPDRSGYSIGRVRRFALKVQQFTGPLMAKAFEDTTMYRHLRLLALNEVGGQLTDPKIDPDTFHRRLSARASEWPHGMTATATHDTKRGEDARARLLTLSEMGERWSRLARTCFTLNARLAIEVNGRRAPSLSHEYLFYQSLLGAWPMQADDAHLADRMCAYVIKAARESKTATSWMQPDETYEAALTNFVRRALDADQSAAFLSEFAAFAQQAALLGALNSLAQLALKATVPGVPDFYQGGELWDLSLVDPDNRQPVDFSLRADSLNALGESVDWGALAGRWRDGRIKLALTHALLKVRQELPEVFLKGDYRPLQARGQRASSVIGYSRNSGDQSVIVVVGRLMCHVAAAGEHWPRGEDWADTKVEVDVAGPFHDALSGGMVEDLRLAKLFTAMPVAVLRSR